MMLRRILADLQLNTRVWSRYPGQIGLSIAIPCVMFVVLGLVADAGPAPGVAILDEDASPGSAGLVEALSGLPSARVLPGAPPGDPFAWMRSEGVAVLVQIPRGFEEGLRATPAAATVHVLAAEGAAASGLDDRVQAEIDRYAATLAGTRLPIAVEETVEATAAPQRGYRDHLLAGMIGLVVLSLGFLGAANVSTAYSGLGVFRKLATTPLRKGEWIAAKIVLQSVLVLAGTALLLLVAVLLSGSLVALNAAFVAVLVLGAASMSALGLAVVAAAKRPERRGMVLNAIYVPMMFLSGTFVPVERLPGLLQPVSAVLPLTHIVRALDASLGGAGLRDVAGPLLLVAAFGAVLAFVAVRRTEWDEED